MGWAGEKSYLGMVSETPVHQRGVAIDLEVCDMFDYVLSQITIRALSFVDEGVDMQERFTV